MKNLLTALIMITMAGSGHAAELTTRTTITSTTEKVAPAKVVGNTMCPIGCRPVGQSVADRNAIHKGYQVALCCTMCRKRFATDPDKYLQLALDDARMNAEKKQ